MTLHEIRLRRGELSEQLSVILSGSNGRRMTDEEQHDANALLAELDDQDGMASRK